MMIAKKLLTDPDVQTILDVLEQDYAQHHPKARIEAYRYDDSSLRLRIIDPDFQKLSWEKRFDLVWDMLARRRPARVMEQFLFLVALTPQESTDSAMSKEFDHPTPEEAGR